MSDEIVEAFAGETTSKGTYGTTTTPVVERVRRRARKRSTVARVAAHGAFASGKASSLRGRLGPAGHRRMIGPQGARIS